METAAKPASKKKKNAKEKTSSKKKEKHKTSSETMMNGGKGIHDCDLAKKDLDLEEKVNSSLEGARHANVGLRSIGVEAIRLVAKEIVKEIKQRQATKKPVNDLMNLLQQIAEFHIEDNADTKAVDLLMEVDKLDMLIDIFFYRRILFVSFGSGTDPHSLKPITSYLSSLARLCGQAKKMEVLDVAYRLYSMKCDFFEAFRVALGMGNAEYVKSTFAARTYLPEKLQLCYILARQGISIKLAKEVTDNVEDGELLRELISNSKLSDSYRNLARNLNVMEAESPDDLFKADLMDGLASAGASVDSGRQILAATFVNGFVNAGFGVSTLMTAPGTEGSSGDWVFKLQEHGKASAAASLGLIMLWDVDGGLPLVDKYLYSNDKHVVAGALLAVGIINCGVRHERDAAYALLHDSVNKKDLTIRVGGILGLGLAYAGSQKREVLELLTPIVQDLKVGVDIAGFAAVALGLVYVGSCDKDVAQSIVLALTQRSETELGEPLARFLCLGLGLLYLGKQDAADATMEMAKTLNKKISKYCLVTIETCAYAGTGNLEKFKALVSMCGDHLEKGNNHQAPAVLGIALVAMAEKVRCDGAIESLEDLLQCDEQNIRRAVPLALGILSISNPKIRVMDLLEGLVNDDDSEVGMSATISLGLIGAGTNDAEIVRILRDLSRHYEDTDASRLFCVKIAQGLVHMGKGLMTLDPYHSDRFLLSNVALAGLVTFLHASFDMKSFMLGKYHHVLYFLVLAMQPRMLITLDEELKPLPVPVRVGRAVDVEGPAGCWKTIPEFQRRTTPVILAAGERAELDTKEYIPLSTVLEGFVILKRTSAAFLDDGSWFSFFCC